MSRPPKSERGSAWKYNPREMARRRGARQQTEYEQWQEIYQTLRAMEGQDKPVTLVAPCCTCSRYTLVKDEGESALQLWQRGWKYDFSRSQWQCPTCWFREREIRRWTLSVELMWEFVRDTTLKAASELSAQWTGLANALPGAFVAAEGEHHAR